MAYPSKLCRTPDSRCAWSQNASSHLCPPQQLENSPVPVLPFTLIQVLRLECTIHRNSQESVGTNTDAGAHCAHLQDASCALSKKLNAWHVLGYQQEHPIFLRTS
eukprot:1154925-Pelagomonas_calceolata.AAC.2